VLGVLRQHVWRLIELGDGPDDRIPDGQVVTFTATTALEDNCRGEMENAAGARKSLDTNHGLCTGQGFRETLRDDAEELREALHTQRCLLTLDQPVEHQERPLLLVTVSGVVRIDEDVGIKKKRVGGDRRRAPHVSRRVPSAAALVFMSGEAIIWTSTSSGHTTQSCRGSCGAIKVIPFIPLVLLPSIFLSGILTRGVDQLPRWGQVVSYLIPLRYASDIIQGLITNKTLSGEAGTLVALLVYGALLLDLATLTLREYD